MGLPSHFVDQMADGLLGRKRGIGPQSVMHVLPPDSPIESVQHVVVATDGIGVRN